MSYTLYYDSTASRNGGRSINRFAWFLNILLVVGLLSVVFHLANEKPEGADKFFNETLGSLEFDTWNRSELEDNIHEDINEVRSQRGLERLSYNDNLVEVARYHSADMANSSYFAHDSPSGESMTDRYDKFNVDSCGWKGENIFMIEDYITRNLTELSNKIVNGWMNSKGHRENILTEEFDSEAIGVYRTEDTDDFYVTQNFCG